MLADGAAGMEADNKEATPNDKAGADAIYLALAPLLGSDITDEEEGIPEGEPARGRCRSSECDNHMQCFHQCAKVKFGSRCGQGALLILLHLLVYV